MKNKIYLAVLLSVTSLSSCIPPLYHPSTMNTPMFSKKGEVNVTGGYGKAGADIQAAYSVSNNSGIMVNCSFGNNIQTLVDSGSALTNSGEQINSSAPYNQYQAGYHFNYVEAGYGLYMKPKKGSDFRAEVFGLIGNGYAESFNQLIDYRAFGNYMRYSIQSNLGYVGKVTEGVLSVRAGYLDFSGVTISESSGVGMNNPENATQVSHASGNETSFFIDPAVTFRAGYKGVKLFLQSGMSIPLSGQTKFGWDKSWGSIGVQFRINTGK